LKALAAPVLALWREMPLARSECIIGLLREEVKSASEGCSKSGRFPFALSNPAASNPFFKLIEQSPVLCNLVVKRRHLGCRLAARRKLRDRLPRCDSPANIDAITDP
jgi:hypothetical protein